MYFKCIKYNIQSAHLWQNETTIERKDTMAELTYIRVGDYYIPDLVLDEPKPVRTVGKYGSLRRTCLKQYNRLLYSRGRDICASFPGFYHRRRETPESRRYIHGNVSTRIKNRTPCQREEDGQGAINRPHGK